ncbi:DtxR family iron dependent repressor protein [Marine Group I thaumarchaeote SCGC AAA799-E16]|uniref:DtxR family iron dependent repressor protein n=4 Tax=Marine Group I TaxID=905826 RepID=A0A087S991_9ARCH|nr:DtxR family iron dependent repressor protein [Marine Group I thaumarchaeote SCGC AAA799-N04]KER06512.1 DtxR family iron dependent repressor protein [Marine Group I thaumarchaeote SCGC AAA799-E16]KFM18444.1 DtxR family iron dependent repressor protein [Marine Group I thaumarchaeote SCGC RSA3]KFM22295.1 DtxR family iron dependent repressor protein [Marine Group I thaumarchaeote SCGC AAA799-B03]
MAKKLAKKSTSLPTLSGFSEFDRIFDNFKKDMEKSFSSFPRIDFSSFPKLPESGCDVIDEEMVCGIEHHMNKQFTNALCIMLNHPRKCPHNNEIPMGECCLKM